MNAIILKGASLRQPPLPQSGPRAKTNAHPWSRALQTQGRNLRILALVGLIQWSVMYCNASP
jgi:hypothetical protein